MKRSLLAVAAILLALPAAAEKPNIKLGQAALHPYYSIKGTYDDNIYLVPKSDLSGKVGGDVMHSWIISNNAGLGAELPVGEMHKFKAAYDARYDAYTRDPSANNAVTQKADASYDFKGSRSKARVFDSYLNTRDPQFDPFANAVVGELISRQARWQNTFGVSAEYFLGEKFFFGADAQNTVQKYLDSAMSAQLNRSEGQAGVKTGYKIQPKTRVYVSGHRAVTHYSAGQGTDHAANHKDWLLNGGVEGEFTAKLKGQVQSGLSYRQHDKDASKTVARDQLKTVTRNWIVSAGLQYKPTEADTIKLIARRAVNDAVSGGNYYITNGASLDLAHKMNKVTVGGSAGMQVDKYSETTTVGGVTANRRDDTYSGGVNATYDIQEWLAVRADYLHQSRFSIFSHQYNYRDNKTSLELKVSF
jgi:hypothetical protein